MLDTSSESVQTFAAMGDSELRGKTLGWVGDGPDGVRTRDPPARRGLRPGCLQPHAREGRAAGRAGREGRGHASRAGRPRDRLHDGRRPGGLQGRRARRERAAVALRRRAGGDRGLVDDLARGFRGGPGPDGGSRRRAARGARQREPVGGRCRQADGRRVGADRRLGGRAAVSRALRRRRDLRGGGRRRPPREDLPQPDARRGGPVTRGDHRARREGRCLARRVPRVPQQERDGLDVHALQDAGDREPRLHADVHPGAPLQGLPSRLRGGRGARRADAGRGGSPTGRPGAHGVRLRRHRLHGAAGARGARLRDSSSSPRTCR